MKTKIMRLTGLVLCLMLAMFAFAACSKDAEKSGGSAGGNQEVTEEAKAPIIGSWESVDISGAIYTFGEDGIGNYEFSGSNMPFTYSDDGKTVKITYDGTSNENVCNYTIDGDQLSIEDSFGEIVVYKRK